MTESIDFLHQGESSAFIDSLCVEILHHPAVRHPFLVRLANGDFSNVPAVLRDYAHQYSVYSEWFTRYLDGVIGNLHQQNHIDALMENMEEEKGIPDSADLSLRPHVELFNRFKQQIGADEQYCQQTDPCTTVLLWRDLFLQKCKSNITGVGIAAIGLGTEYIIPTIYPYIACAIENHTDLGTDGSLFFRIHIHCDDGHAETTKQIIREVSEDISTREAIRFGVFSSLNLRRAFWDAQLARAMHI